MAYPSEGTLTTDEREVAISETWDSSAEWNAAQSMENVVVENGVVMLEDIPAIPAYTVDYRYIAESFATPWPDETETEDMTVNGLVSSTFSNGEPSVFGDGTDDYGLADGPQNHPQYETFGIALTPAFENWSGFNYFLGMDNDDADTLAVRSDANGADGNVGVFLRDANGNLLRVYTDSAYDDGTPKAIVINKNGNSASDIDIYVDGMSTPVSMTIDGDQAFDHTNYSTAVECAFWARNDSTARDLFGAFDVGAIEFKPSPYSQSDRDAFVNWRPEV